MALSSLNIFTIEIDGRPTVVFDAASIEEARGICALPEFRADLCGLTAGGTSVCDEASILAARYADAAEIASFNRAAAGAAVSDGPTMAFLIKVDGVVVTIADPG